MRTSARSVFLAAAATIIAAAVYVHAEEPSGNDGNRLSIRARARATAPADEVELEVAVLGCAEEAREAERIHRDRLGNVLAALTGKPVHAEPDELADDPEGERTKKKPKRKRRAHADDEALPTPGVPDADGLVYSVREGRYSIGSGAPVEPDEDVEPGDPKAQTPEVRVGSSVVVSLSNVAKSTPAKVRRLVARVLDRAVEAGAEPGSSGKARLRPALRFRVKDREALRRAAYADAVTKGTAHALELARLGKAELGRLVGVVELEGGGPPAVSFQDDGYEAFLGIGVDAADETASLSSEVTVEVWLHLEFVLR